MKITVELRAGQSEAEEYSVQFSKALEIQFSFGEAEKTLYVTSLKRKTSLFFSFPYMSYI